MDGENTGKPGFKMDDLEGKPTILGNPHVFPIENCDVPLPCVFSGG